MCPDEAVLTYPCVDRKPARQVVGQNGRSESDVAARSYVDPGGVRLVKVAFERELGGRVNIHLPKVRVI